MTGTDAHELRRGRRRRASVPAAATPLSRCRRASASHGSTAAAGAAGAAPRADDDVGRRERVEAPDDLVARGLREAERRDERADADDGAEHGERRRAAGRASRPGERLGQQVARSMRGPRTAPLRRLGRGRRAHAGLLREDAVDDPHAPVARARRRASSWVITTSVSPSCAELVEEREHGVGVGRVEVARRLVAQQQARVAQQRAGDRDALLLAAREPRGQEVGAVGHADALERRQRALRAGPRAAPPR